MNKNSLIDIFDTTLRDGTQSASISLSIQDKLLITQRLDEFGVDYIERRHGETSAEQQQRHNTLQKAIERERKRRARAQQSPEERRSTQDANTAARKRTRAQQSPEVRRSTQDADTASRKRTRAQQSQEERDDGRRQDREARRRKRSVDELVIVSSMIIAFIIH